MRKPIFSSRADDPELADDVEEFIVSLAETVDSLQDAEFKSDFSQLQALASNLASQADRLGFGSLAASANAVEGCCGDRDLEEIREVLLDLTEIAKRIRLGHRGAV